MKERAPAPHTVGLSITPVTPTRGRRGSTTAAGARSRGTSWNGSRLSNGDGVRLLLQRRSRRHDRRSLIWAIRPKRCCQSEGNRLNSDGRLSSGAGAVPAGNPREGPRASGYYLKEIHHRGDRRQCQAVHRSGCSARCTGCSISGQSGRCPTAQLLDRFVSGRDEAAEAAFEELVIRHAPMVLQVCRDALHDAHDAEDAFQAVFLVLASRAGSVRRAGSIASWLFGVARRVAARSRRAAARRRRLDRRVAERNPEGISRRRPTPTGRPSTRRSRPCPIGCANRSSSATCKGRPTRRRRTTSASRRRPSGAGWPGRASGCVGGWPGAA